MDKHRGSFATRIGIVMAAAGSSVGLGNIWRFPVETGQHGGAAFILLYLACVIFLGLPMMTAEFIIGRRTHTDIASAYEQLVRENPSAPGRLAWLRKRLNSLWPLTGYAGMLCVTLILSYYAVVAGWVLKYALSAAAGSLASVTDASAYFADFCSSTWSPLLFALIFIALTHIIIERGVQNGIERFSKVLMPLLFLLMLFLAIGSLTMPGASRGVDFLLKPDFTKIDSKVVLGAMGQAFFSLSIAIGCLATYASYFKPDVPLMKTAANVVGIDTMVAILSGFIVFPAVFSVEGVSPDAGPGLVFVTLPSIFSNLFGSTPVLGYVFSLMFYVLLVLAALTSTISMHEEVTAFFVDRYHTSRRRAATYMTLTTAVLCSLCALSFGPLSDFRPFFGRGFFDAFNDVTALWIMPLSGIVLSLFVGWRLPKALVIEELTNHHTLRSPRWLFVSFFFLIRWIAPAAIALIFINELLA
ncbi:MAG: sodium-dependent transporter [Bacteroidaceae bacterium]|nr:sodium-dependent transporter [Bacteroidaceae bacterium]